MKLKKICAGFLSLSLFSLANCVYAAHFAPEHIQCELVSNALSCRDFDRQYLTEHTHTADFPGGQVFFSFASAIAYMDLDEKWSVFFTYKDANQKNVTLKSINPTIKPVLSNGAWVKLRENTYSCDAGYRNCQFVD